MRGRFAPSPTGPMHLGNARTALLAWLAVRAAGGRMVLRIEDLDRARVLPGAEDRLVGDLQWLGLDWDEGPVRQSDRAGLYQRAVDSLLAQGRAFLCACSRADVSRAASAPHEREDSEAPDNANANAADEPRYPGTCRALPAAEVQARAAARGRQPAVRFRAEGARHPFPDLLRGPVDPFGAAGVDDFVLCRADGTAAYQLAVVVDDAAMGITDVVRGDDLLRSTPRQLALYQALALSPPRFAHVPLVLSAAGDRLAKRSGGDTSIADLRAAGLSPGIVVGALAASAGLCAAGQEARPADLVAAFDLARLPRQPVTIELPVRAPPRAPS